MTALKPMSEQVDSDSYDREYNPRLQIPNAADHFAQWSSRAEEARAQCDPLIDLAYGSTEGERLDFFPSQIAHSPVLIFIHGGYWRALDKRDFSWIAPAYLAAGCSVAVVNYGLAPKTSVPEIANQMRRACSWIYANDRRLGISADRIFLSGHSAGGHLTALMLATDWPRFKSGLPSSLIAGAVAISGIFDLVPLLRARFLQNDILLQPEEQRLLSPINLEPLNAAPLLLGLGELETVSFHEQSENFSAKWSSSVAQPVMKVAGRNHFSVCDALAEPEGQLFAATHSLVHSGATSMTAAS